MIELDQLKQFLVKANLPHATGTAQMKPENDGSRTITFTDGEWFMHDNFFGGEPYGGRQVVFYKGKPQWLCVYYGEIAESDRSVDEVYGFLREALQHAPADKPYRGPGHFTKNNLTYKNTVTGDADNYTGTEVILANKVEIYRANYLGGLVDQHAPASF